MNRRQFIKGAALALLFSKPSFSALAKNKLLDGTKKKKQSIAAFGKGVFKAEKRELEGLVRIDESKIARKYKRLVLDALAKYRKLYGAGVPKTDLKCIHALAVFLGELHNRNGFKYREGSLLSQAIEGDFLDCDLTVMAGADFLMSLGVPPEKLAYASTTPDVHSEDSHVFLRIGDRYVEPIIKPRQDGGFEIFGYDTANISKYYRQFPEAPFGRRDIAQNWNGILETLAGFINVENDRPQKDLTSVQKLKDYTKRALKLSDEQVKLAPDDAAVWQNNGFFHALAAQAAYLAGEPEENVEAHAKTAYESLKEAIRLNEEYPSAYFTRALLNEFMLKHRDAITDLEIAIMLMAPGRKQNEAVERLKEWEKKR